MSKTNCQAGYTLLELLLVVLLVLLFTGAAVMNVAPLAQGARLDEGVGQLETLLRFARAEAAQQGRRHQLQIQTATEVPPAQRAAIAVRWEPEPLDAPGVFVRSQSTAALANLRRLCETHLAGEYSIEVIDLLKNPTLAAGDQIVAIPTLVRKLPTPMKKILGDLSNETRVLVGLDLRAA